ncbi:MAG: hypothetical protein NZ845_04680 [Thermodesulfovibrio sp.]|nr:hypothetical protein [Thermodesulfovibrio sp.]MCX7724060.1 hypothetical protein [Thermodesulfovibrio sp.]MDW7972638.1 hypothetical protein [Thermodesulfovibrio sp.]
MNQIHLIPQSEPIPAPSEIFIFLEQLFFLIHIVIINSILGVSLIIFYKWNKNQDFFDINKPLVKKIPILFALGINMAIPALLFLQVVFGHLFYTSSILMGTFWILIIPFLIIAYYSSYFHYKKFGVSNYAKLSLFLVILMIFYIAFMFVNNLSMMEMPEKWTSYFSNRKGTILLWSVSSIYPRFSHFIVASLAIGGIVYSLYFRKSSEEKLKEGLKIFAYATIIQIATGFWFFLTLPENIMKKFMGEDLFATSVFLFGVLTAFISVFFSLKGKLKLSLIFLILTLVFMIINRYNLRVFHLGESFNVSQLKILPQWDVFAVFLVIFILGVFVILYMLKISVLKSKRG